MEAVEDKVGGNSRALAQKIARDHPGMQPHTKSRKIITVLSLHSRVNFRVVRGDSRLPPTLELIKVVWPIFLSSRFKGSI